jgi:uncharacterized membrane protein YbhN (UPF0104 family)
VRLGDRGPHRDRGEVEPEVRSMARPRWQRLTIAAVKGVVAVVVLWAVGRHVVRTWDDLGSRRVTLRFEPLWLIGSGLLYLAGLLAYGVFYQGILRAGASPIGLVPALRAYLVSHLGKYVPGKAMVVVIRAGMVVPFGARASTAAIATFYETLVMMAAGGFVAAAGFAAAVGSKPVAVTLPGLGAVAVPAYALAALAGLGLGVAFLAVVLPSVFGRLAALVSLPIPGVGPEALPRLTARLLGAGLLWSTAGWILLGLSQVAAVRAFDAGGARALAAPGLLPVVIASVALATVAGFVVAVLPGGLGVREGVLMSALTPVLGSDRSVVAALSLRLVWVAAELAAAAVLVPVVRRPRDLMQPPLGAGPIAP